MTVAQAKLSVAAAKELLKGDPDGRRGVVRAVLREVPEAEVTDALGAARASAAPAGSATARATPAARWSPGSASWSRGCRRTGTGASRPSCSSATSAPSRRSWRARP